ncbi:MAG: inorganic diphosphatase [Alphaproteobacteria bacterium]|nr:inorganic diphosphatase [Alphaproteobacteria bacterium]
MTDFLHLPSRAAQGGLNVVVETPRGSRAKFKFDPALQTFRMSRPLTLGLRYPFDWGFVPSTCAEDGDPLDALVIHDNESYPGVVIPCRPIGVLEVVQQEDGRKFRNDRVLFAPEEAPRQQNIDDLPKLSRALKEELERFFLAAIVGTEKKLKIKGWRGAHAAMRAVKRAEASFKSE